MPGGRSSEQFKTEYGAISEAQKGTPFTYFYIT